jgi:hypothetical protein
VISIQEINNDVLKNINRPDVGWEEHRKIIKELREHYPHFPSWVQLIQGLPGQTVESWRKTLQTIIEFPVYLSIFTSELLPASPASLDASYQDRFQFKYSNSTRWDGFKFFTGTFPESCISFNRKDFVEMTSISLIFSALMVIRLDKPLLDKKINFHELADCLMQSEEFNLWKEDLYNNWCNNNSFYYTKKFGKSSESEIMSACTVFNSSSTLAYNKNFQNLIIESCNSSDKILLTGEVISINDFNN